MKFLFTFLSVALTSIAAHADLVIQQQTAIGQEKTGSSFNITIKIHGNMIRSDSVRNSTGKTVSIIQDVNTGDSETLSIMNQQKTFRKISGVEEKKFIEEMKIQLGYTNSADATLLKPTDTGKSEKVGDYDAEVYIWSSVHGEITEKLWVAKDFPNYETIKVDLSKLEKSGGLGLSKGMMADMSMTPGMVVKLQTIMKIGESDLTKTTTLVSVKEESVDPSIFKVPNDYKEFTPPVNSSQPAYAPSSNK